MTLALDLAPLEPLEPLPVHRGVLWLLDAQIESFQVAPKLKIIAAAMHWKNTRTAADVLENMRRRCLIEWDGRTANSIKITKHGRRFL